MYGYVDIIFSEPKMIGIVRSIEMANLINGKKENRIRLMKMVSIDHQQPPYQHYRWNHPKYHNLLQIKKWGKKNKKIQW